MTPQEIAEARPLLLDFTAEMLGGLPRKDQRAAGHASCAADWRLFCPESWDDDDAAGEVAAAGIRRRRERAHIPDDVRHTGKWRLALEMLDEMAGPGGWGVLERVTAAGHARPVAVAGARY